MGVFLLSGPCPLSSSSSAWLLSTSYFAPSTKPITASPFSGLHLKPIDLHSKWLDGRCFHAPIIMMRRGVDTMTVKASFEIKGAGQDSWGHVPGGEATSESDDEEVLLDKLPLDSKLQQKLEHKMRMKLAKNIRLRRKKLVRKRRMRKRGRWPPLKVSRLKNV